MKKPVVIGCGNMGSAIIDALLKQNMFTVGDFTIVEKQENAFTQKFLKEKATILDRLDRLPDDLELVILAVKPQDSKTVLTEIAPKTNQKTMVLSIMAGISIAAMESRLPRAQIIRCMPNTPCSIHQGMTVYCGNSQVSATFFQLAQQILGAMGKAFQVTDEIMIDAATAISGSGPAYVFFLAEALKEGASRLGFNDDQSDMLATQTLLGAAMLLDQSPESPGELCRRVTSPGGTTAAALNRFAESGLKEELIKGFKAAFQRSLELGQK
ncbi:pyrroline-5-carboxylate reductase [bacterium]|nr:pyrroline-5-carboxylate reductase [bacterium]